MTYSRRTLLFLFGPLFLLLIPFVGNIVSDEVHWTVSDFLVGGLMLFGLGAILTLVIRGVQNRMRRILLVLAVLLLFLLVWAELAVGVFGTPLAGS